MNRNYSETEQETVAVDTGKNDRQHHLIVWNDDVNTFDWVIKALIEICHHTPEQAEQCALLIHLTGKYAVKNGEDAVLIPMCESLIDWGINASID